MIKIFNKQYWIDLFNRLFVVPENTHEPMRFTKPERKLATIREVAEVTPIDNADAIVLRPHTETFEHKIGRVSFKVVSPEWLIKYKA